MTELALIRKLARKATTPRKLQYKGTSSSGVALKGEELDKLALQLQEKLQANKYTCWYTNLPLTLGINASIDHQYPSSKYPALQNNIDNLVWCRIEINRLKNNMELSDFYQFLDDLKNSDF